MKTSLIVAADLHDAIGRRNELPWHLKADLRRFQLLTMGHVMVMGSATYKSIGRPLPGRISVVLSRWPDPPRGSMVMVPFEPAAALAFAQELEEFNGRDEVFVIGGARVYKELLPYAQRIYLTRVDIEVPDADTFMSAGWLDAFEAASEPGFPQPDPESGVSFRFETYERRAHNG
jgi:dihydrofolate reductase